MSILETLPIFYKEIGATLGRINEPPLMKLSDIPDSKMRFTPSFYCKSGLHIGQRKLFLSELQFLSNFYPKLKNNEIHYVVYAGAAPANHTYYLASFFSNIKLILIDPAKFEMNLSNVFHYEIDASSRGFKYLTSKYYKNFPSEPQMNWIKIIRESSARIFMIEDYMSDELAALFKELDPIFISDIRTNNNEDGEFPSDLDFVWNMAMQYNWINIMRPKGYMLKFRAPFYEKKNIIPLDNHVSTFTLSKKYGIDFIHDYNAKKFRYLDGEIYLQAFCGRKSSESRLCHFSKTLKIREYDYKDYENKFFLYNTVERVFVHRMNKLSNPAFSFDHCNDCAIEANIWETYYRNVRKINIYKCINTLNNVTERTLGMNAHGGFFTPNKEYILERVNYAHIETDAIPFVHIKHAKKQQIKTFEPSEKDIMRQIINLVPAEYKKLYLTNFAKCFIKTSTKMSLNDVKGSFPLLHKLRSFKPVAHSLQNSIRGQFLYFTRLVIEKRIDLLIIIDAFSGERFVDPLVQFLGIPIINLRYDALNSYEDLPKKLDKLQFYKCKYPDSWEKLQILKKHGKIGLFHAPWAHEPRDRRVMKEEYLGLNARIYNIIQAAQPHVYLIGFEPYTDPAPFNNNLYMRHIDHIIEAKKNGYDHVDLYHKNIYLFLDGDPWIIPYMANKSFKTLICGEFKKSIKLYAYDIDEYCQKHMFYNQFERPFNFHPNKYANEDLYYDFCNDCSLDALILEKYCLAKRKDFQKTWQFLRTQIKNDLCENGHGFLFIGNKRVISTMYQHESALIENSRSTGL
jgi:hypothetical protein